MFLIYELYCFISIDWAVLLPVLPTELDPPWIFVLYLLEVGMLIGWWKSTLPVEIFENFRSLILIWF